jgi:hypothetical protein
MQSLSDEHSPEVGFFPEGLDGLFGPVGVFGLVGAPPDVAVPKRRAVPVVPSVHILPPDTVSS